jgi:hypothetical protein
VSFSVFRENILRGNLSHTSSCLPFV